MALSVEGEWQVLCSKQHSTERKWSKGWIMEMDMSTTWVGGVQRKMKRWSNLSNNAVQCNARTSRASFLPARDRRYWPHCSNASLPFHSLTLRTAAYSPSPSPSLELDLPKTVLGQTPLFAANQAPPKMRCSLQTHIRHCIPPWAGRAPRPFLAPSRTSPSPSPPVVAASCPPVTLETNM